MNDNQSLIPDESSVPAMPTGIRYGAILAMISIVLGLISHVMGYTDPTAGFSMGPILLGLLGFAVLIGIVIVAIRKHRDDELGGYISLGRSVVLGLWIGLVSGVIGAVWNYVNMNFINPELKEMIDATMDEARTQVEDGEAPEAVGAMMEFFTNPVYQAVFGIIWSIIFMAIIALIAGAFMKRERPLN